MKVKPTNYIFPNGIFYPMTHWGLNFNRHSRLYAMDFYNGGLMTVPGEPRFKEYIVGVWKVKQGTFKIK